MSWSKRRRADPLRVAEASLLGARRRLADLSRPEFASRYTPEHLALERADALDSIARNSERIRQLGGDPDAPRLEPQ